MKPLSRLAGLQNPYITLDNIERYELNGNFSQKSGLLNNIGKKPEERPVPEEVVNGLRNTKPETEFPFEGKTWTKQASNYTFSHDCASVITAELEEYFDQLQKTLGTRIPSACVYPDAPHVNNGTYRIPGVSIFSLSIADNPTNGLFTVDIRSRFETIAAGTVRYTPSNPEPPR